MKDPNVLEASGLCMNGNPVTHEDDTVQQIFFRLWHFDDAVHCEDYRIFDGDGIGDHKPKGFFGGVLVKELQYASKSLANTGLNPFKNQNNDFLPTA